MGPSGPRRGTEACAGRDRATSSPSSRASGSRPFAVPARAGADPLKPPIRGRKSRRWREVADTPLGRPACDELALADDDLAVQHHVHAASEHDFARRFRDERDLHRLVERKFHFDIV